MTQLEKISPKDLMTRLAAKNVLLIDVRESDEFVREHVPEAISHPVSKLDALSVAGADEQVVFMCRSGMRTDANCAALSAKAPGRALILDGGLDAWKKEGLPTKVDDKAPLEINRQVQMTAGFLVLAGVLLSAFVHPLWIGVSAFVGAGLVFAGASGWCGMAHLLKIMPWNRVSA